MTATATTIKQNVTRVYGSSTDVFITLGTLREVVKRADENAIPDSAHVTVGGVSSSGEHSGEYRVRTLIVTDTDVIERS